MTEVSRSNLGTFVTLEEFSAGEISAWIFLLSLQLTHILYVSHLCGSTVGTYSSCSIKPDIKSLHQHQINQEPFFLYRGCPLFVVRPSTFNYGCDSR